MSRSPGRSRATNSRSQIALVVLAGFALWQQAKSVLAAGDGNAGAEPAFAARILEHSGVRHGVVVHLGFGDGQRTASLARGGIRLVHGISSNPQLVTAARRHIRQNKLGGRVSVHHGSFSELPYAEYLVNLLVADNALALLTEGLTFQEVFRVLTPLGVACFGGEIDAAKLKAAGFAETRTASGWTYATKPRPKEMDDWSHLNYDASGNRVSNDLLVSPPTRLRWMHGPTWPMVDGGSTPSAVISANGRIFYNGINMPPTASGTRSLVARDAYNGTLLWARDPPAFGHPACFLAHADKLYAVLVRGGPLVALSAATGEVVRGYKESGAPQSALYHDGKLVTSGRGFLSCLEAESGALKWRFKASTIPSKINRRGQLFPNMLVGENKVYYLETGREPYNLGCLDLESGLLLWQKEIDLQNVFLCSFQAGVLILGEAGFGVEKSKAVHGFSAKDGTKLWEHEFTPPAHGGSNADGFFVDGLYWVHVLDAALAAKLKWRTQATGWRALDPKSGEVVKSFNYPVGQRILHRCHMDKATTRFLIGGGTDFVEPRTQKHIPVRFARGICQLGLVPANGLVYSYPYGCECFPFMRGFVALAGEATGSAAQGKTEPSLVLQRGPAFGTAAPLEDTPVQAEDWPCFRHDDRRSLTASTDVSTGLTRLWSAELGGELTAPVAAGGLVLVARAEAHEIVALQANNGQTAWRFTADGRIDSPPTVHDGLAIFGCRDGSVYALRAADGVLAWRLRPASKTHLIVAREQMESAYPIHGSVAVKEGVACFVAGRHSSLAGGLTVYGVEPSTGSILWQRPVHTPNQGGHVADILAGDDEHLYLGRLGFQPGSGESVASFSTRSGSARSKHLVAGRGYAPIFDRTWAGRTIRNRGPVRGYVLAFDEEHTYGLTLGKHAHAKSSYVHLRTRGAGAGNFRLFRAEIESDPGWSVSLPIQARPLLVAGEYLFVGGAPDSPTPEGGELRAYAAKDGAPLGQWKIGSAPVDDGMAAARGSLYLSTKNDRLHCFGRRGETR